MLGLYQFGFANEKIYVNREVTTHIVMPENIKLVDISTTKIIGNQCADNIVRIKPYQETIPFQAQNIRKRSCWGHSTLIGERHIAQYDILYTHFSEHGCIHLPSGIQRYEILHQSGSVHAHV